MRIRACPLVILPLKSRRSRCPLTIEAGGEENGSTPCKDDTRIERAQCLILPIAQNLFE
jgi:hypothetical protein